jgi:hypothetical protein
MAEEYDEYLKALSLSPAAVGCSMIRMRPVANLRIRGIGAPWIRAFLTVFKPEAENVTITCGSTSWTDDPMEYVAATAHFVSFPKFRTFAVLQDKDEQRDPAAYIECGLRVSLNLFKQLLKLWQGRGIAMYTYDLRKEYVSVEDHLLEGLAWDDIFKWTERSS